MDTLSRFKIKLTDLPDEGATLRWHLDDAFFEALDEQEIAHGSLDATLRVNRTSGAYQLQLHIVGDVEVPCDRCLEPMAQPIDTSDTIDVRLGDHDDDDGECITVTEDKAEVDVSWKLYETIALALPIYHVHPDGQCPEDINRFFAGNSDDGGTADDDTASPHIDQRWEALRSLLDNDNSQN